LLTNPDGSTGGLVTGYYEPLLRGSRTRGKPYLQPVLGVPADLLTIDLGDVLPELKNHAPARPPADGKKVVPYYSRAEITSRERGAYADPRAAAMGRRPDRAVLPADPGLRPRQTDVLFILLGAIMVLAMHAGFAFLELGTVRGKNQVNALVKILSDFAMSTLAYFFVGYGIAYGTGFLVGADRLVAGSGYELTKFFFLLTFAAAIPAIVSGGIAERARFYPQLAATAAIVGVVYPVFEGMAWNNRFGFQDWITSTFGAAFHDFAGSVVVHAVGGWIALAAVVLLGARQGRYRRDGGIASHPPSSIPFLALGAWILTVGWFGFNVMSAQTLDKISGLVAVNSLMAMVGGTLVALLLGKQRPGLRPQRSAGRARRGLRGVRPDASGRGARHRCGRGGRLRRAVPDHPEPLADRRRARRLAPARHLRRLGRDRRRDLRQPGTGRPRRRRLHAAADHNGADLSIHNITSTPERESNW
jgi:hypothetical protein